MAIILDESFEGVGWEESWSEASGNGCSIDEDATDLARPPGGGDQHLKLVFGNDGNTVYVQHAEASAVDVVYVRILFALSAINVDQQIIARGYDASSNTYAMLRQETTGGVTKVSLLYYNNGTLVTGWTSDNLSVDTWYMIEWYYNKSVGSEHFSARWEDNPVAIIDQALSGTLRGAHKSLVLGSGSDTGYVGNYYFDLIRINDGDGWIGAEATGGSSILLLSDFLGGDCGRMGNMR